jgi:hypothetical protein
VHVICDDVHAMVIDAVVMHRAPTDTTLLAHLDSCAACRAAGEQYERVWQELGDLATSGPSPDARARFALRLAATRLAAPSPAPRSTFPWNLAAVAAAVVVAVLAGYYVGGLRTTDRAASVPSEAQAAEPTYLLLLHEDSTFRRGEAPVPRAVMVAEYVRWAGGLERGTLISDAALPDSAIWLGPPHAPIALGDRVDGFFEIRAKDRAEAERVAATCPHLKHGGRIEVRLIDRS